MKRFKISNQAALDLENIWSYVAKNNPRAADNLFDKLREKFAKLAKFPQMGEGRENLAFSLRSFPVGSYLIFYRTLDGGIEIVRIIHGSQDIEQIFKEVEDIEDI
ncbi:type II toxin-antitoxin system RelE/ParE family toxin [Komarekiella sp. 'clone 1']|uniref:Toxin n=1 Tax=Komarekiella delphini-convector SJRDD-AB1 TaxID=2593771 RepID=A0AA40T3N8_9NOST|nr:type II toxin-antitoxin system RelE/ParE family toxin [Komarekiella delphini-convector]MBD6620002.1 type II toxin-antitoxin system RelE/ParE family toxin [Komarekiella delphini-convector SJRDD-AB1]